MTMFDDNLQKQILDIILSNPRNFMKVLRSKKFKYLIDYIYQCTPLLDDSIHTFKTRLYWTIAKLEDFPICLNDKNGIHKMTTTNVKKLKDGYPKFCNSGCQHESPKYFLTIRNAMKTKYGVENPFQLKSVKDKLKTNKDKIQLKRDTTRKMNLRSGLTSVSEPEDQSYKLLVDRFGEEDVLRQYKSQVYPFSCDFYIKHLDIYIECNYSWVHGEHRFNNRDRNDILQVEFWRSFNSKYYDNAVDTWTRRDIIKFETAELNRLNYYAFYIIDDLKCWLECSIF